MTMVLIDYGAGNIRNVEKAFEAIGISTRRTDNPQEVYDAEVVVMPGVGAFGDMMNALCQRGLIEPIRHAAASGKPLLGICVGLQILFEVGEEMGTHDGLGIFPGKVSRFPVTDLKVPHVGWNEVRVQQHHPIFEGVPSVDYAYFVHSYRAIPTDPSLILADCEYGTPFPAVCGRDNVVGIQFHPEKSQQYGLTLLKNFATWATA